MTARFYRRLFARSRTSESRVVKCKFRVFQRDCISQNESSREYRVSQASVRFRRIFISRAKRLGGRCSFRSGERTRRKENFSARKEIAFTAQRANLIFRVAETIPRERDDFADIADDFMKCGREFSFISFFSLSLCHSLHFLSFHSSSSFYS